jgi:hypothetical protein
MISVDRLAQYDFAMTRLQRIWAYLLKRKMRHYR